VLGLGEGEPAQVGRMAEPLQRNGQREWTLIVFMSDHGEMLGDHGMYLNVRTSTRLPCT
jgi:arylsulfatase A-like enzyme